MLAAAVAASTSLAIAAGVRPAASAAPAARADQGPGGPTGLGQLTGLLPASHLTLESAIQVNLSNETVRLPLYPGEAGGKRVWYVLLDVSITGLAHDLGVNYAPKLANIAISDPAAVQTVTARLANTTAERFRARGRALRRRAGLHPDPDRDAGADGFPLAKFQPGSIASRDTPSSRSRLPNVVYNAPIVATGDGPFDVTHRTNAEDRVLGVHIAGPSKPGQFAESWADLLFVEGLRRRPADRLPQH